MGQALKPTKREMGASDARARRPFRAIYDRWHKLDQLAYERGRLAVAREHGVRPGLALCVVLLTGSP